MKHTKEPWKVIPPDGNSDQWFVSRTPDGSHAPKFYIAVLGTPDSTDADQYDAERIVACVNACEGISTEALEDGVIEELIDIMEASARRVEMPISETLSKLKAAE